MLKLLKPKDYAVTQCGRMKVSDHTARVIMNLRGWFTQPEIAKMFGCKVSLVADIHTGRRKILD